MNSIVITLQCPILGRECDLEVPMEVSGKRLAKDIAEVCSALWPDGVFSENDHRVYIVRDQRFLKDNESLSDAGCKNGDILLLAHKGLEE